MSQNDLDRREIIGNLISNPRLTNTDTGSLICYCKVATNPRARRYDAKTGEKVPDEQRNRTRSAVELKIIKPQVAKKFSEMLSKGERVWVKGEAFTRTVPKLFYSKKEDCWMPGLIDIDGDGQKQEILEEQQGLIVEEFAKIVIEEGVSHRIVV